MRRLMKREIYRGPRATIQAPPGRYFIAFDADGLHLRIATYASQDPFMLTALTKYDQTRDPIWKPHIQNCSALFHISPEEAIALMKVESPKYTFAKNFIYMLLNGGDVPALKNAAVSAGLVMDEKEVKKLLDSWLERASRFDQWRKDLVDEARRTGSVTMPSGRRRRFYSIRWKNGVPRIDADTLKEIFNAPLIMTEIDFMNPRVRRVWDITQGSDWFLFYHGHDGFMLEGPASEAKSMSETILRALDPWHQFSKTVRMFVPFDSKGGDNWAHMGKVGECFGNIVNL